MLFKSAIITEARGSLGGITASRNRGGGYFRARVVPVNPGTSFQQLIRSAMASLAAKWNDVLTDLQRKAWDTYALNVPMPNSVGDMVNVGGVGMYVRSNVPRIASLTAGLTRVDDAPTIFDLGDVGIQSVGAASEAAQTISMLYDDTDTWCDEDGSALLIYTARPKNPAINYMKGPYRLASVVEGDSTTPPTSPDAAASAFPFVENQRMFVQTRVTRADGRLSSPFRGFSLAVA